MKIYYVWIGTFDENDFTQYCDNKPYENAMELWKYGSGTKPSEYIRCGFCQEMNLKELDKKDFWYCFSASLCTPQEMARNYIPIDLDAFEQACAEKGIQQGNVIWGILVKEFPDINPTMCKSMTYIGKVEF